MLYQIRGCEQVKTGIKCLNYSLYNLYPLHKLDHIDLKPKVAPIMEFCCIKLEDVKKVNR